MTSGHKIKVLIVDDTALYRKILKDVLSSFDEIEIVGTAPNGKIALSKIDHLKPDFVTLDVEMPELNGIETLKRIKSANPAISVIMVSALTQRDAKITLEALNLGAFDFIAKPSSSNLMENIKNLEMQFKPKLEAFLRRNGASVLPAQTVLGKKPTALDDIQARMKRISSSFKPQLVAIGVSTGGPKALAEVIPKLPANLTAPVLIVQHMPPLFTKALAESLDKKSTLKVLEAEGEETLQNGTVYIAPGGKHMKVFSTPGSNQKMIKVTDDPPENFCKPSVDYLFRSLSTIYKGNLLCVIMTGMGKDGTLGLRLIKRTGGHVIAQDESSCVVYGMPMEAVKAGVVDMEVPLTEIASKITELVKG